MPKIQKPSPPEHLVIVDTNLLWHEDKSFVVHPDFSAFWENYSESFPMKLLLPEAVVGELLFQQTTSALKHLDKANQEITEISRITNKGYSHRVTHERIKTQVNDRFQSWIVARNAEIKKTPITDINWGSMIEASIWRKLPFTPDPKNPRNEKGFRDALILETVVSVCRYYSAQVNIAFLCCDYALRTAADERLKGINNFSTYESLKDFESFIELTKKNLTESFVKSILFRAREKFHNEEDHKCLIYDGNFHEELRNQYADKIENPREELSSLFPFTPSAPKWEHLGKEQLWVTRPQFEKLEGENIYHWRSRLTFVRLYQRLSQSSWAGLLKLDEKRLLIFSIDVFWKARVRADGRFFDCTISEHKEGPCSFKEPTTEELERYGLEKMAEKSLAPPNTPESAIPSSQ